MTNPFGPQNANVASSPGAFYNRYGDHETWCKDCDDPQSNNATVLDAAFFNMLIGNLNKLVALSGVDTNGPGDLQAVYKAVVQLAKANARAAPEGGLRDTAGGLKLALGTADQETFAEGNDKQPNARDDVVTIYSPQHGVFGTLSLSELVRAVLVASGGAGIELDANSGKIIITAPQVVPATADVAGVAQIATSALANEGDDNTRIMTPARMKEAIPNVDPFCKRAIYANAAALPAANTVRGGSAFVENIGAAGQMVYSDGTNWRRFDTNAIV